jgi:gluconokinase
LTRVITWADARCRADAAELRAELKEKEIHSRTGCMLRASFWPAKLRWLRRMDPRLFSRVTQWMSPAEWLQMQLAGGAHCALGMATGTGLFNPVKLAWDPELLKKCAVDPEQLRPLTDDPVPVSGRLASQFPELKGVPWFPAIGDGAAHNLGCGSTRPGFAAINVGTSAAIRVMRQGAKGDKTVGAPLGLFCYRVDDSRYLVGGAVSNAGNLRAWALRELRITDGPDLEAVLGERKEPKHGLAVLPFWTAERAPHWNEEDHGMIHGFTQHTTAVDILQALTEATYQRIALIAERLLEGEESAPKLIVGGGIQKSASSLQRLANVLGMPVYPNDEPEASLKGAAIFALERLGHPAPEHRLAASVRPQVKLSRMYEEQRERMKTLEEKMRAL